MKILLFSFISLAISLSNALESRMIAWQSGNWAFACDFIGNDLSNVKIAGEKCGQKCSETKDCTHFTWTTLNGGTCWMKSGKVGKSDAFYTGDNSAVCGIIESSNDFDNNDEENNNGNIDIPISDSEFDCQFRYGRDYTGDETDYTPYDYVTIWVGAIAEGCSGKPSCTDFNPYWLGSMLKKIKSINKMAVFYAYIIAFEGRNSQGLQDCNVGHPSLCEKGSQFIRENRARILERYDHYASNIANILGSNSKSIFLIEPDFWQYYGDAKQQGGGLSGHEMRVLFDEIAETIKKHLPNSLISWDIAPWVESHEMTLYWNFFKTSKHINYISTSGGGSRGDLWEIIPGEQTWQFMSSLTGKKIIADSGYGWFGTGQNNRDPWYDPNNINSRIANGVLAVSLAGADRVPTYRPKLC